MKTPSATNPTSSVTPVKPSNGYNQTGDVIIELNPYRGNDCFLGPDHEQEATHAFEALAPTLPHPSSVTPLTPLLPEPVDGEIEATLVNLKIPQFLQRKEDDAMTTQMPILKRPGNPTMTGQILCRSKTANLPITAQGTRELATVPATPPPSSQTPERPRRSYGTPIPLVAVPAVPPPAAMKPTVVMPRVAAQTALVRTVTVVTTEQFDREIAADQDNNAWKQVATAFAVGILATATMAGAAALLLR